MLLEREYRLSDSLRSRIYTFMTVCRGRGDKGVAYPVDEEDTCHYLLWEEEGDEVRPESVLAGIFAVMPLFDGSAECIAYVHPDERRKGYFSQILLPAACEDFPGLEFAFPVRDADHAAQAALESAGAQFDVTEYMMELSLAPLYADDPAGRSLGTSDKTEPSAPVSADPPSVYIYPPDEEPPVASCRLEKISPDSVCLFQVQVRPEKRGQGYGTAMILSLADELKRYGIWRIVVHVSADNLPAVALYEKTGFRTTETLSYYIF